MPRKHSSRPASLLMFLRPFQHNPARVDKGPGLRFPIFLDAPQGERILISLTSPTSSKIANRRPDPHRCQNPSLFTTLDGESREGQLRFSKLLCDEVLKQKVLHRFYIFCYFLISYRVALYRVGDFKRPPRVIKSINQ